MSSHGPSYSSFGDVNQWRHNEQNYIMKNGRHVSMLCTLNDDDCYHNVDYLRCEISSIMNYFSSLLIHDINYEIDIYG